MYQFQLLFIGCAILQLPRLVTKINIRIKEIFAKDPSKNKIIMPNGICSTVEIC